MCTITVVITDRMLLPSQGGIIGVPRSINKEFNVVFGYNKFVYTTKSQLNCKQAKRSQLKLSVCKVVKGRKIVWPGCLEDS